MYSKIREKLNKYDLAALSLLWAAFIGMSLYFFDFTIDDAYISLRYSKHLAEGHGLVWNIGENPVEGFTSLLWVLIGSIPHLLNLNAAIFMKIVSTVSGVSIITLVYNYGRHKGKDIITSFAVSSIAAFNPAFVLITIQGMETTFATFLVALSAILALEYQQNRRKYTLSGLCITLFLGMITRPELVLFGIGVLSGLVFLNRHSSPQVFNIIAYSFVLIAIPGLLYMFSRHLYFGHLFPNPFYIKKSTGISLYGINDVFEFVIYTSTPLIALSLFENKLSDGSKAQNKLIRLSPLILGGSIFLTIWFFFEPIQGYLYRYQTPMLPILQLVLLKTAPDLTTGSPLKKVQNFDYATILGIALIVFAALFPLNLYPDVRKIYQDQKQDDRVKVGKALAQFSGENHSMFVSESGALPYYSEWDARDLLGLNSEHIAHNGLDTEYIYTYQPDLVMFATSIEPNLIQKKSSILANFLNNSKYRLVANIKKTNRNDRYHVYFVKSDIREYSRISCKLRTIDSVRYGSLEHIIANTELNFQLSNIEKHSCVNLMN